MADHVLALGTAIKAAAEGDVGGAAALLRGIPNDGRFRDWYVDHAQLAWVTRVDISERRAMPRGGQGPRMPAAQVKRDVWQRDQYQCRYCGLPVIPRHVLATFSAVVGAAFSFGGTNAGKHEIALLAWAQLDHVRPFSVGGCNQPTNIVTACAACNYGKDRFTVEQLGLENPFHRPPSSMEWDGGVSSYPSLRQLTQSKRFDHVT